MSEQAQRPTVATVFAILHFVFGGLGAIFGLLALSTFAISIVLGVMSLLGLAVSALLIFAGITLITNKSNALQINLIYAAVSVVVTVVNIILSIVVFKTGFSATSLIGVIYPALVYFLVVNNQACKDFYNK